MRDLPPELGRAIARAIATGARVVLTQHEIPGAEKLASELGNNCAQNVFLLVERFLDDGILAAPESGIEADKPR
jgi:hypothetical protein